MPTPLIARRPRLCLALAALGGLAVGLVVAPAGEPRLLAGNADRWQDRVLATGPIAVEVNKQNMKFNQDAIYYLNYQNGLLMAAVPSYSQSGANVRVLSDFAERDLVKDFDIRPGTSPHFLMTTADLGIRSEGWAPLFVFETETGQVATYRVVPRMANGSDRPQFLLIERRTDPRLARALAKATDAVTSPR